MIPFTIHYATCDPTNLSFWLGEGESGDMECVCGMRYTINKCDIYIILYIYADLPSIHSSSTPYIFLIQWNGNRQMQ